MWGSNPRKVVLVSTGSPSCRVDIVRINTAETDCWFGFAASYINLCSESTLWIQALFYFQNYILEGMLTNCSLAEGFYALVSSRLWIFSGLLECSSLLEVKLIISFSCIPKKIPKSFIWCMKIPTRNHKNILNFESGWLMRGIVDTNPSIMLSK